MSTAAETAIDIRPFQVEIPDEELAELRRRIEATRWPSKWHQIDTRPLRTRRRISVPPV
jgi:Epoxide hydrolase N terminus